MTSLFSNLLERWLGLESGPGEGTAWSLENSWRLAPWMTLLLIVLSALWVWYFYARETGSAGRIARMGLSLLRLAAIGVLLFMIAEFAITLRRTGLPYVAVIVDDSASMGISDRWNDDALEAQLKARLKTARLDEFSRLNLAKLLLVEDESKLLATIAEKYKLKVYFLAGAAQPQTGSLDELVTKIRDVKADGDSSRLGEGARDVLADLRGSPPAAVILLTDGITTDGPSLSQVADQARRKGVPFLTVGLGSESPVVDVELVDLLVDEIVFVDDVVTFEATIRASGLKGRQVPVTLRRRDGNETLAETQVTLPSEGQPVKVRLPYRPKEVGQFEFVVEVGGQPEESRNENNRAARVVSVRKEKIRVLLVQAYPSHEFRYLKQMLQRNDTIELATVLQEADLDYAQIDRSALRVFPVRREELFHYDVLILGDVDPTFLSATAAENIRDFVTRKGGGLILLAGPRHLPWDFRGTPLEPLFPIEFADLRRPDPAEVYSEAFSLQPTPLGLSQSALQLGDTAAETASLWQGLPPLYWFQDATKLKDAARVLATHPTRTMADGGKLPLIATQFVGAGKVLYHGIDETWRWRFRLGDALYSRYWVQSIRFLARAKLLGGEQAAEITVDRREYLRGEPVRLRVRFLDDRLAPAADDGVTVVLNQRGNRSRKLTLQRAAGGRGIFEATFSEATEGEYEVWVAAPSVVGKTPSASFLVTAPPGEFERIAMDADDLSQAAEATRGKFYTIRTVGRLIDELPEGRQVPVETLPPLVLWNRAGILLLFLALLIGEWTLRQKMGMV